MHAVKASPAAVPSTASTRRRDPDRRLRSCRRRFPAVAASRPSAASPPTPPPRRSVQNLSFREGGVRAALAE